MTYTSEYNAQLARIVAAIKTVIDVGRVHDRPRHGSFLDMWMTEIDGIQVIRSWEISVGPERTERLQQAHRHRYRTWEIRGVVAVMDLDPADDEAIPADTHTDASYHLINRLAGEITDALEGDRLAGTAAGAWIDLLDPPTKAEPVVVEIGGGPICWGVTLTVVPYTIVSP